jgi:polar amino acid transport system substrate-binding protein
MLGELITVAHRPWLNAILAGERMKKIILIMAYNAVMLFSFAQNTLTIGTNDLPPYIIANSKSGLLIELISEVGKEMNMKFNIVFLPWKRCETKLLEGEIWGIMPYVKTTKRALSYEFSDPLIMKRTLFFYYSKDPKIKIAYEQYSDLKKYHIGGINGYFYEKWFYDAGLNVEYTNSEENNLRKLYDGRIDLTPVGDITGWYIIRNTFPKEDQKNFHTIEKPLDEGNIYIMIRKNDIKSLKELKIFNTALKHVKEQSIYSMIISEYIKE